MEPSGLLILAYVLIVVGLFLLAAELFMPSGTFLVLSLTAIVIGVAMTFLYSNDPTPGIVTLICVFVAITLVPRPLVVRTNMTAGARPGVFSGATRTGAERLGGDGRRSGR